MSSASNLLSVQPPPIWAPIYGPVQVQTGAGGGGGAFTGRSAAIADVASAVSPSVVSPSATPKVRIIAPLRNNELGFGLRRIHLAESLMTPIAPGKYWTEVCKYCGRVFTQISSPVAFLHRIKNHGKQIILCGN